MSSVASKGEGGKAPAGPTAVKGDPSMTGVVKAALWLLSADEETAVATLQLLSPDEVRRLRIAAETLQRVSPQELAKVHSEFKYILEQQPLRLRGSVSYLSRLAAAAYGESTAARLLRLPEEEVPVTTMLDETDGQMLAVALMDEHPQIIAAILSSLAPARASALLKHFEGGLREQVVRRLAQLKVVPHEALERAQKYFAQNLPRLDHDDNAIDGVRVAAKVLNEVGKDEAEKVLIELGGENDPVAVKVRAAMFTFEDLGRLDKRGLQTLLKDVPSDRLLLALKAASDEFKAKIFGGMSMRAAEMMRDDLQAMGPAKVADVEQAQQDVVNIAVRLRDEGKITVMGAGGFV